MVGPDAEGLISTNLFGVSISSIRNFPRTRSPEFQVFWIRSLYLPEGCSDTQMEELERLTERCVTDRMAEN
jgi:hypothetical protein